MRDPFTLGLTLLSVALTAFAQICLKIGVGDERLQALLEQHRRIVETAPAEVDRKRLEASQRATVLVVRSPTTRPSDVTGTCEKFRGWKKLKTLSIGAPASTV